MAEYRFSMILKWQVGIYLCYDWQLVLGLPFLELRLSLSKDAHGLDIFGHEI